jgi:hypothetical protein
MVRTVAFEDAQRGRRAKPDETTKLATEFDWRSEAPPPRGRETAANSFRPGPHRDSGPWFKWT